jgi:hypothetical protein
MHELVQPLLATQSDTEPPITSDDNIHTDDNIRASADSPVLAPSVLKTPVARLKKGKAKKGRNSLVQSRYKAYCISLIL